MQPLYADMNSGSAPILVEIGIAVMGLAFLAKLARWFGFSEIPLYLLAGLAFGKGGVLPLQFSEEFVSVGAEVGVLLLLFMLGIEYSASNLVRSIRTGYPSAIVDFALNFTPGFIAGVLLKFSIPICFLLGGITYVSSSGVIAKILSERRMFTKRVSAPVVSILVLEDLAMTLYLPIASVLVSGTQMSQAITTCIVAICVVYLVLFLAAKRGEQFSKFVDRQSDDIVSLLIIGAILVVSGLAQYLQISAAVGAFIVGVAVSGPLVKRAEKLMSPLRDLFAAIFFLFFGLQTDPQILVPALGAAVMLAAVTILTKMMTGIYVAKRAGTSDRDARIAGATLIPRGEFSIVIAGLGAAAEPRLAGLAAAYVLITAMVGPVLVAILAGRLTPAKS